MVTGADMRRDEALVLKVTTEIVVKFIEMGRLSLNSFEEGWDLVHRKVKASLQEAESESPAEPSS